MGDFNQRLKLPQLDLLLDYFDGLLDEKSTIELTNQINESEELLGIIEGIQFYYHSKGRDRSSIESYIHELGLDFHIEQLKNGIEKPKNNNTYKYIGIAASVLVILTFSVIYFMNQVDELNQIVMNEIENRYPAPEIFRGGENATTLIWEEVVNQYQSQQFEKAEKLLFQLKLIDKSDKSIDFYLGLTRLYAVSDSYTDAVNYFHDVANSEHRLSEKADWFLAIAYYQNHQTKAFENQIIKVSENNSYRSKEANQILKALNQ